MMKIQIYQISKDRDAGHAAFCALNALERVTGSKDIQSAIYDKVYTADVECRNLEQVFEMFNLRHPGDFKGHSLSVSDVVEVIHSDAEEPGFYFCDSWGWQKIDFDPSLAQVSPNYREAQKPKTISVLLVEPGKYPRTVEVEADYRAMQRLVGGTMETVDLSPDGVKLVCCSEGKNMGLPYNRAIFREPAETAMTYKEMKELFRKREDEGGEHLTGYIVFSQDSFNREYSELSRTYAVSSNNKAFQSGMGGYSIFASCLDGTDPCLRLEGYMADEKAGENGWKVERCYVKEGTRELADIIAGSFFITYAPPDSEVFKSLPADLVYQYTKRFRFPEHFIETGGKTEVIPYRPDKGKEVR